MPRKVHTWVIEFALGEAHKITRFPWVKRGTESSPRVKLVPASVRPDYSPRHFRSAGRASIWLADAIAPPSSQLYLPELKRTKWMKRARTNRNAAFATSTRRGSNSIQILCIFSLRTVMRRCPVSTRSRGYRCCVPGLLEPGLPHPNQDVCYHRDRNKTKPTLHVSTVEFLGFIAGQPRWATALLTHGFTSHVLSSQMPQ